MNGRVRCNVCLEWVAYTDREERCEPCAEWAEYDAAVEAVIVAIKGLSVPSLTPTSQRRVS